MCVLFLVARVFRSYAETAGSRRLIAVDLVSSALLGMGIQFLLVPPLFWWWLHGSRERYLWIISGPLPYSQFGSGPLQLWIAVFSGTLGIALFLLGVLMRKRLLPAAGKR